MTSPDDLEQQEREREDYLVAFYELTKDQPLRWSTHRAVAAEAGIPDDRVMTVSQDLAGRGLITLRTMGGLDGYIELTPGGVAEAERAIRTRGTVVPPRSSITIESILEADQAWADRYMPLLKMGFDAFVRDGSWPEIDAAQRALDRERREIDVREALQDLQRLPGDARPGLATTFYLPVRILRWLPDAGPVLDICLQLIKRAVELYFSDADALQITSPSLRVRCPAG